MQWDTNLHPFEMIAQARSNFANQFFMEIFMTASWNLWKIRNGVIFDNKAPSIATWKAMLKKDIILHLHRIKEALHHLVYQWMNTF